MDLQSKRETFFNEALEMYKNLLKFIEENNFEACYKILFNITDYLKNAKVYKLVLSGLLRSRPSDRKKYQQFLIDFLHHKLNYDYDDDDDGLRKEIQIAFIKGDVEKARPLMKKIPDGHVEQYDQGDFVTFAFCNLESREQMLKFLIKNKVGMQHCNINGNLYFQFLKYFTKKEDEDLISISKLFLNVENDMIDSSKLMEANDLGETALYISFQSNNTSLIKYLINESTNVDIKTKGGGSPLHKAANFGDFSIVKMLIDKKVDVNAINMLGETPLSYARIRGNVEIAEFLKSEGAIEFLSFDEENFEFINIH